jgi:homoserine kinase
MIPNNVLVKVPATTANLGPGFDSLGLALNLYNRVSFTLGGKGIIVEKKGEGEACLPSDSTNYIYQAFKKAYAAHGSKLPSGLNIHCENNIPIGSGLGSSAAAALAGLLGANELLGKPFQQEDILNLAVEMDGHPDNAAPALLGGLAVVTHDSNGKLVYQRFDIPKLKIFIVVPQFDFPTNKARAVLPSRNLLSDAGLNIGRAVLVAQAFIKGDIRLLGKVMDDKLHQPFRIPLIPGAQAAMNIAKEAGAIAVALSGAGPSIVAFTEYENDVIIQAMVKSFKKEKIKARGFYLSVNNEGAKVKLIPNP